MEDKCPLCSDDADVKVWRDGSEVNCSRCGNFRLTATFEVTLRGKDVEEGKLRRYLACYIRQENLAGTHPVILVAHTWREIAQAQKNTRATSKIIKTLELLTTRAEPGTRIELNLKTDAPLIGAVSAGELSILLNHLNDLGYIDWSNNLQKDSCYVTTKGWQYLESLATTAGIPGRCFVAMWFDASLQDAYENGIYAAVKEDCKMDPVRIDLVEHNEKICDKIVAEIRTCQFAIADVTGQRPGVYFEAGFAMGLGRPVIWTCRSDDLVKVHFDTRQYNHIVWETPHHLREKLTDRIRATVMK